MSDTLRDGTTDWHNWMRDTMMIDPNDKRTIAIVWACIVRCKADFAILGTEPARDCLNCGRQCPNDCPQDKTP